MTPQQKGWETRRRRRAAELAEAARDAEQLSCEYDAAQEIARIMAGSPIAAARADRLGPRPSAWILIAAIVGVALTLIASRLGVAHG